MFLLLDLSHYTGDTQENELLFYGVVKDNNDKIVEGAAVMVFVCYNGGIEKLLGYNYTDNEGTYIVNIPVLPEYKGLDGFKVIAGKGSLPPERNIFPVSYAESPRKSSSNIDFYDFLKLVSNNPGKTIFELFKRFN